MKESKISILTATLININLMVGAGMYVNPSLMAQKAGSLSYLGWALSALLLLPVALCIVEISKIFPGEGSFYTYSEKVLGKTAGFLSGWVYFLGYVAVQAMQTLAARDVLSYQLGMYWIKSHPIMFNALFFALLALISMINLNTIAKIQNTLTIVKIIPVLFALVLVFLVSPSPALLEPTANSTVGNLHFLLPLALFGYWGFEGSVNVSHRIKGGSSSAAKSIIMALAITVTIFTVFHLSLLRIMGSHDLSIYGVAAFTQYMPFVSQGLLKVINIVLPVLIALSLMNSTFGASTSFSFLLQSMAKDDLLFFSKYLKRMNNNHQPYVAIIMQSLLGFAFISVANNKNILLAISNLGVLGAFFVTLISLFILEKRRKNRTGLITTMLGFASCSLLAYFSFFEISRIEYALLFAAIIAIGFIMFKLQKRKSIS